MIFKLHDPAEHARYTGASNDRIRANLLTVLESDKDVMVRMPLIPGCNDHEKDLEELGSFLEKARSRVFFEVLPYHRLGEAKYARLGRPYPLSGLEPPTPDRLEQAARVLEKFALNLKIGQRH